MRRFIVAVTIALAGCGAGDDAVSRLAKGQPVALYNKDRNFAIVHRGGGKDFEPVDLGIRCTVIDDEDERKDEYRPVRIRLQQGDGWTGVTDRHFLRPSTP